ncbi:hypothetical protein B0H10DRAFT_2033960, partial [Mycena sp. CBHHK59/15]
MSPRLAVQSILWQSMAAHLPLRIRPQPACKPGGIPQHATLTPARLPVRICHVNNPHHQHASPVHCVVASSWPANSSLVVFSLAPLFTEPPLPHPLSILSNPRAS